MKVRSYGWSGVWCNGGGGLGSSNSSYIDFGYENNLVNDTLYHEMRTSDATANGQGFRMIFDGKVTNMSVQFDVFNFNSTADVVIEIFKNGVATGCFIITTVTGVGSTGTVSACTPPITYVSGDRITTYIRHSDNGISTNNHALLMRFEETP